jgi:hypothetical protein
VKHVTPFLKVLSCCIDNESVRYILCNNNLFVDAASLGLIPELSIAFAPKASIIT